MKFTDIIARRQVVRVDIPHGDEGLGVESCRVEMDSSQVRPMFPFLAVLDNIQPQLGPPQTKYFESGKKMNKENIFPVST